MDEYLFARFAQNDIMASMVQEPILGIAHARLRAILETDGEMLLFVDDDNDLIHSMATMTAQYSALYSELLKHSAG